MANVLVIAAHPDDEILGCGGTASKHVQKGDKVKVLIMAEGLTSRDQATSTDEISVLHGQSKEANKILGIEDVVLFSLPDNRMDSMVLLEVVKIIEKEIDQFNPDIIYTHYCSDVNIDHQVISEAVQVATRPVPGQGVKELYFFEVPSSTEWRFNDNSQFRPNYFNNIDQTLSKKLEAMKIYQSEMRDFPHPRSLDGIESLAKWRGATSGFNYAEAFMIGRILDT